MPGLLIQPAGNMRYITNFLMYIPSGWSHCVVRNSQCAAQNTILAKIRFIALMTYVVKYFKWLFIQPKAFWVVSPFKISPELLCQDLFYVYKCLHNPGTCECSVSVHECPICAHEPPMSVHGAIGAHKSWCPWCPWCLRVSTLHRPFWREHAPQVTTLIVEAASQVAVLT